MVKITRGGGPDENVHQIEDLNVSSQLRGDFVACHTDGDNSQVVTTDTQKNMDYWGPRQLNHHTEATSMLYGARECARLLVEEGVDATVERHRRHGAAMLAGVTGLGLAVFGDVSHKMSNVVAVHIPDGIDGEAARSTMLLDFGIEIGTSFGPLRGKVWRIGTMGYNARKDAVLITLAALEQVLRLGGVGVTAGRRGRRGPGGVRRVGGSDSPTPDFPNPGPPNPGPPNPGPPNPGPPNLGPLRPDSAESDATAGSVDPATTAPGVLDRCAELSRRAV